MSSAVNAFTVVIVNDFVERRGVVAATDAQRKRFAIGLACAIGTVVILFRLLVGYVPGNFVEVTSRTIQLFIPLELGIVLLALLSGLGITPFAVFWGVMYGFAGGVITSYWQLLTGHKGISFTLYMVVILAVQLAATFLISLVPIQKLAGAGRSAVSGLLGAALATMAAVVLLAS